MISYASRTGTITTLDALRVAGWRLLVSARGKLRTEGFAYALDNGAWTAHQKGERFDDRAFCRAVDLLGAGADFVTVPDIVGGGQRSLDMSVSWLPALSGLRLMLAVQEGIGLDDIRDLIGPDLGIFVGGLSSDWKEQTTPAWAALARSRGARCHVGRVNTVRRIVICQKAGVDSIDGTNITKWPCNLPRLVRALEAA